MFQELGKRGLGITGLGSKNNRESSGQEDGT